MKVNIGDTWITRDDTYYEIISIWEKGAPVASNHDSIGRANAFSGPNCKSQEIKFTTEFTEDFLVAKISKEETPEYFL